jgi:rubrerythrin
MDVEYNERVKGRKYRCNDCGETFEAIGKHPVCPSCQSENVSEI